MIYLVCDSMYAGYEQGEFWDANKGKLDYKLVEAGFSVRFHPLIFNYKMDIDDFVSIYDGAWPMCLTSGDLADWEKVK